MPVTCVYRFVYLNTIALFSNFNVCLCVHFVYRKTTNRHDSCMIAQEKLHPVCAQRPPDNNNQQSYTPPPSCHAVAEACKEDRECR